MLSDQEEETVQHILNVCVFAWQLESSKNYLLVMCRVRPYYDLTSDYSQNCIFFLEWRRRAACHLMLINLVLPLHEVGRLLCTGLFPHPLSKGQRHTALLREKKLK